MIDENLRDEAAIININSELVGSPLSVLKSLHTTNTALQKYHVKETKQKDESLKNVRDILGETLKQLN